MFFDHRCARSVQLDGSGKNTAVRSRDSFPTALSDGFMFNPSPRGLSAPRGAHPNFSTMDRSTATFPLRAPCGRRTESRRSIDPRAIDWLSAEQSTRGTPAVYDDARFPLFLPRFPKLARPPGDPTEGIQSKPSGSRARDVFHWARPMTSQPARQMKDSCPSLSLCLLRDSTSKF